MSMMGVSNYCALCVKHLSDEESSRSWRKKWIKENVPEEYIDNCIDHMKLVWKLQRRAKENGRTQFKSHVWRE